MKQVRGDASGRRRGGHGALANKRAADSHANALALTIHELRTAGFISRSALADELNRAGISTAHGGRWHRTTVTRILTRLGLVIWGKDARINNGQAKKRAADVRAEMLASTIAEIQNAGFIYINAITRELIERDTYAEGRQMAPNQREATAAAP
jgi:Recombinase